MVSQHLTSSTEFQGECIYACVCVCWAVVVLHVMQIYTHNDQTDGTPARGPHGWNKQQCKQTPPVLHEDAFEMFHPCSKFRSEIARVCVCVCVWSICNCVLCHTHIWRVGVSARKQTGVSFQLLHLTEQYKKVEKKSYYRQSEFIHVKAHIDDFRQWLVGWENVID